MDSAIQLAGFFAAHGIWCVSDGGPLIPMLAFEKADGKREMQRFAAPELERGVEVGRDWLARNPEGAMQAVLVYDGLVTLEAGKVDALLLDVRVYALPPHSLLMAVPYRPATEGRQFSVYRPKFISCDLSVPDYQALGSAFFRGVDSHAKGAAVWSRCLDQSL
ncbi:MAG: hypothetical protein ABSE16_05115 [Verrucomicrobiota bacterium]|jgi:hypothetical protein